MWQSQTQTSSSFRESIKALEADVQHANTMVYVDGIPTMSPQERKATIREFYAIIYPSLKQLEGNLVELTKESAKITRLCNASNGEGVEKKRQSCKSIHGEEECDICMETGSKVVLPNCGHSMCVVCFHDWYIRSQSCPFCRGSLKRVSSGDLWVLTSDCDVVDSTILAQENLKRFYLYIDKLPLAVHDTNGMLYDYI